MQWQSSAEPLTDGPQRLFKIDEARQETGLPKETLRAWERRYAFPKPRRDDGGERAYTQADIDKLRLMKKLVDRGFRPSAIVERTFPELRALLVEAEPRALNPRDEQRFAPVLRAIKLHDSDALQDLLREAMQRQGTELFVTDTVAALTATVGARWVTGEFEIFEEHLFSETLQLVLRSAISSVQSRDGRPTVLLTTLPGEAHQIGLLMAHVLFALEGARCVSLGPQTPHRDIAKAAIAHQAEIVALSIAQCFPLTSAMTALADLDELLPPAVEVWIGGSETRQLRNVPNRTRILPALADIRSTLQSWRASRSAR